MTPFLSSIQVPLVLSMLYLRSTLDTILSSIRVPLAIGRFGALGVSTPPATQIIQSQVKLILVPHAHSIMFANHLNQSLFSPWKSSLHQNELRSRRKRGRWWWWLCQLRTGKKLHDLACHQMTRHYKLYMMWRFTFGLHWKLCLLNNVIRGSLWWRAAPLPTASMCQYCFFFSPLLLASIFHNVDHPYFNALSDQWKYMCTVVVCTFLVNWNMKYCFEFNVELAVR